LQDVHPPTESEVAATFQDVAAGANFALLATLTTTSGATHSATSLTASKAMVAIWDGVDDYYSRALTIAFSNDNGSSYGTPITISNVTGNLMYGVLLITQTGVTATKVMWGRAYSSPD